MGKNPNMKRGMQSMVKQVLQQASASQKKLRLDKERAVAAARKDARNHQQAAERARVPFTSAQRILLIGEGNFSFATALTDIFLATELKAIAERFNTPKVDAELGDADPSIVEASAEIDTEAEVEVVEAPITAEQAPPLALTTAMIGSKITATSYDSAEILSQKYDDAAGNVEQLRTRGVRVLHDVDGTKLHTIAELVSGPKFDRIIFVFPHTGCGIKDRARNIADQQGMLMGFFTSAVRLLSAEGEIHITIKRGEPYESWKVPGLARDCHVLRLVRAYEFFPHLYPGYAHRRTLGFAENISDADNNEISVGATTYVFGARINPEEAAALKKQAHKKARRMQREQDD
jgi:25S rRNA (uracil2634-N3)-methyltransferase